MKKYNSILQSIKQYKLNSYFLKNVFLIASIILLPLLIVLAIIYNYSKNITQTEIQTANNNTTTTLINNIESYLANANTISTFILEQTNILSELSNTASTFCYDNVMAVKELNSTLQQMPTVMNFKEKIMIIDHKQQYYFYNTGEYGSYRNKSGFLTPKMLSKSTRWFTIQKFNKKNCLIYSQSKNNFSVVIEVQISSLFSIIQNSVTSPYKLQIFDGFGEQIYSSSELSDIDNVQNLSDDFVISNQQSNLTNFRYILLKPFDNFSSNYENLKNIIILLFSISGILVIFLSITVTFKLFRPIHYITNLLKESEQMLGWEPQINKNKLDELQFISKGIEMQSMFSQSMRKELNKKVADFKKAQALALQSQIDSHFLYNYLENINWEAMIQIGQKNNISKMVTTLSKLLRFSLDNTNTLISIDDELKHIKLYLTAQSYRYPDQITIDWNIEQKVCECKILKLTLQPIIENIFIHGLKDNKQKVHISISAYFKDNYIIIEIKDNGKGMDAFHLYNLNLRLKNKDNDCSEHIGLINVAQRLRIIYDIEVPIEVFSQQEKYTLVRIKILKS